LASVHFKNPRSERCSYPFFGFRARVLEGTPDPADDVAGALWIGAEEVDGVDFAWEHDRGFVRAALEQRD